jgi:hypothetical protein
MASNNSNNITIDNNNKLTNNAKIKTTTDNSDITAEWTVHAQFTILHPGSKGHKKPNDNTNPTSNKQQPVHVVYKWCSDDVKQQTFNNSNDNVDNSTGEVQHSITNFKAKNAVLASSESPKVDMDFWIGSQGGVLWVTVLCKSVRKWEIIEPCVGGTSKTYLYLVIFCIKSRIPVFKLYLASFFPFMLVGDKLAPWGTYERMKQMSC